MSTLVAHEPPLIPVLPERRGGRAARAGVRDAYRPDADALAAAPTRIVIAVGAEPQNTFTGRTA